MPQYTSATIFPTNPPSLGSSSGTDPLPNAAVGPGPERSSRQLPPLWSAAAEFMQLLVGLDPASAIGTYENYRKMRTDPTIALARAVALGPIEQAEHTWEADDDVPDEVVDFVAAHMDRFWQPLVADMLRAVDYGWQSFELVWDLEEDAQIFTKIKALLPELTVIVIDPATGELLGVRQSEEVNLGEGKYFLFTHDKEGSNYYGRSRLENLRRYVWSFWLNTMKQQNLYFGKAAAIIPLLRYAVGNTPDESGVLRPNNLIAVDILNRAASGNGVAIPMTLQPWMESAIRAGANLKDMLSWDLDFFQGESGHGAEMMGFSEYLDKLKFRGYLIPERAASEAKASGSRADSESHGEVGLLEAEKLLQQVVDCINAGPVDQFLEANYGPDARGAVRAVPQPLSDTSIAFMREIVKAVLIAPNNADIVVSDLDFDAMLEALGLPKRKGVKQIELPEPPVVAGPGGAAPKGKGLSLSARFMATVFRRRARPVMDGIALNCGTGAGGFQSGNDCGGSGGGSGGGAVGRARVPGTVGGARKSGGRGRGGKKKGKPNWPGMSPNPQPRHYAEDPSDASQPVFQETPGQKGQAADPGMGSGDITHQEQEKRRLAEVRRAQSRLAGSRHLEVVPTAAEARVAKRASAGHNLSPEELRVWNGYLGRKKGRALSLHEYTCVHAVLTGTDADLVREISRRIDPDDLAADGLEYSPHVTARYGLHTDDPDQVRAMVKGVADPFDLTLGLTSYFPGAEHDVVYVQVVSPDLEEIHRLLGDLAHTDTQAEYVPHLTIAYVKPGRGEKYAGDGTVFGRRARVDRLEFSDTNGSRSEIPLG